MSAPTCLKCGDPVTDHHTKRSAIYAVRTACVLKDVLGGE